MDKFGGDLLSHGLVVLEAGQAASPFLDKRLERQMECERKSPCVLFKEWLQTCCAFFVRRFSKPGAVSQRDDPPRRGP